MIFAASLSPLLTPKSKNLGPKVHLTCYCDSPMNQQSFSDETTFVLCQTYPQGGDSVTLCALSPRDCQREYFFSSRLHRSKLSPCIIEWIQAIDYAGKRARRAEDKAASKLRQ